MAKRILFIVSDANCRGGTEVLAFNLLNQLNRQGYDCWLLSRHIYHGTHSRVLSFEQNDYDKWHKLNDCHLNRIFGYALSDRFFKKLVNDIAIEYQVDWIINHTYDLISAIPVCNRYHSAQIFNWSVIGYEQTLLNSVSKKKFVERLFSRLSLMSSRRRRLNAIRAMHKSIVLTDSAKKELMNLSPCLKVDNIVVIPDPLPFEHNSKLVSSLETKNIVFVGRLSQEKGVMRLLRIWKSFHENNPEYCLKIFGEGHMLTQMKMFIEKNSLKNIEFMGYSTNLKEIYCNADLCCMTSDTEGFGMVLIEAMYFGVPCLSFDCPVSPKEIIGKAGMVVKPFDEMSYSKTMMGMLFDKESMLRFQHWSIKQAEKYLMPTVIKKWIQFLNAI